VFYVKAYAGECDPSVRSHIWATTVTNVGRAMVVYERTVEEGQTTRVVFVHREDCLPKAMALLVNDHGDPHAIAFENFIDRLRLAATVDC